MKCRSIKLLMSLRLLAMAAMLTASPLWAQAEWSEGSGGAIYYNGGNVGIGTVTPQTKLEVAGSGSDGAGNSDLRITATGTIGAGIQLNASGSGGRPYTILSTQNSTGIPGSLGVYDTTTGSYRMVVSPSGDIGIGTISPQHKLSVNGTIGTKEVIVTNTGWSDYVFKPDYRLQPLTEVAAYVQQHQRLPGIPSEQEVQEKGVSLGEMQAKLLAKIEELTLHMIRADERSNRLEQQNSKLADENRDLRQRIANLEAHRSHDDRR